MKKTVLLLLVTMGSFYLQAQTLVGYYPFNGNATDASGNGRDGTVVGGAALTTDRNNTANAAYQTDTLKYITLGNVAALKPTAAITFGGWFYRPTWTNRVHDEGLLSCTEAAGYELTLEAAGVSAYVYRNGGYAIVSQPANLISAGWHLFLATYNGTTTRLYMDGAEVGTPVTTGTTYPITYINNELLIGCEAGSTTANLNEPFFGKADEIRIYNGALAAAQISTLYATTLPLHLISFNIAGNNGAAALSWSSENEKDFARYEVERSTDGINFSLLSLVQPKPSAGRNSYALSDAGIQQGNAYFYRLKMVDKDGAFSYSVVLKFNGSGTGGKLSVYPNPVSNFFILKGIEEIQMVDVLNLQGGLLKRFKPTANNQYPVADLHPGVYTIRVQSKDKIVTARLIK